MKEADHLLPVLEIMKLSVEEPGVSGKTCLLMVLTVVSNSFAAAVADFPSFIISTKS